VLLERRATHFLCWAAGSSRRSRHASACRGRSSGCPTRSRPARADAVRTTCSDSAPRDQDVSSTWCTSLSRPWIRLTTGPFVTLCQPASATNIRALACGTSGKNRRASLVCVCCCDFTSDLLVAYSCFPNIYRNSTESPEERSKLVYLKRTCSRVTSASSALGVLNDYALYKSTHSLGGCQTGVWVIEQQHCANLLCV